MNSEYTLLSGHLIDIDDSQALRSRNNHALVWSNATGRIEKTGPLEQMKEEFPTAIHKKTRESSFVFPGFVDCHVHYPQTRIIGANEKDLLHWLNRHVWPEERKFKEEDYARETAKEFLRQCFKNGTTTALVFGSQFPSAMEQLFSLAHQKKMSLISGLTLQDRNTHEELEHTPQAISSSISQLIEKWHGNARCKYALTPRFSPACTPEMLALCGDFLKNDDSLYFQTHINESPSEISWVAELFPDCKDYLHTYEKHALLTRRSIFAHSIYSTNDELSRMSQCGCGVAHCPSSNAFLGSGIFPFHKHLNAGVNIGMGTDVGGGMSFSLINEMGHAHLIQMRLPVEERYLFDGKSMLKAITMDGARALQLEDEIGNFNHGKFADLVVFEPHEHSYLSLDPQKDIGEQIFRMAITSENDLVEQTFVRGELVFKREENKTLFSS